MCMTGCSLPGDFRKLFGEGDFTKNAASGFNHRYLLVFPCADGHCLGEDVADEFSKEVWPRRLVVGIEGWIVGAHAKQGINLVKKVGGFARVVHIQQLSKGTDIQ